MKVFAKEFIPSVDRLDLSGIVRMVIDFVLLLFSIFFGFISRLLLNIWHSGDGYELAPQLSKIVVHNIKLSLLIPVIALPLFFLAGFYTRGRTYRSRYKIILITYTVSLAYLIVGAVFYFLGKVNNSTFPRSVWFFSWIYSLFFIAGARIAKTLFIRTGVVSTEFYIKTRSKRNPENVLVIGGAGYIGSVLVRKLLKRGYKVRVLDALIFGKSSLQDIIGHPDFQLQKGDFRNVEDVVESMQSIDAVIHLGAIVGDPACSIDDKLTIEVNLAAVRMLAEVAKGNKVSKFVFASTCSVYGASNNVLDENSLLNPVSLYAETKRQAEEVLLNMQSHDFAPTILRLATVHGFSYRPRFDLVVNLLAAKAIFENSITIFGGEQWRPFIHVSDVADAFIKVIEAPREIIAGEIFNVGSNRENYQIKEIGNIIKKLRPETIVHVDTASNDKRNYKVKFDKIRIILGFEPKITVREGILEIWNAIGEGKVKDYKLPQYNNYRFLQDEDNLLKVKVETSLSIIKEYTTQFI